MKRLLLSGCSIFLSATLLALDYSTYAPSPTPGAVQLTYWSDPLSRGFSWQTDATVSAGEVALLEGVRGASDDALFETSSLKATAAVTGVTEEKYAKPILNAYTAHIEGLTAGKTYSYRLGSAGHYVYGQFAVRETASPVTVLNFNDAQTKDASLYPLFENALASAANVVGSASDCDFILQGGDLFDGILRNAGDNSTTTDNTRLFNQWAMAVDTATPHFPGLAWVNVSGNHDQGVYYSKNVVAVAEDFKVNADSYMGCHSFDCGNVHFATIHFFTSTWSGNESRFDRIFNWLREDLAAARENGNADWTVVAMHAGPYTTGDNMRGGSLYAEGLFSSNIVMHIAPICSSNHVDLVLQAHDHTYSKTLPYRWDAKGYAFSETDAAQLNLAAETTVFGGMAYDVDPKGTYYISAGSAGHRVGELSRYADRAGDRSYTNRLLKVATGRINVDSPYAAKGDDASADVGRQMFGVLRVVGKRLTYDFYVAEPNGAATLYDSIGILKTDGASCVSNAVDFSALPPSAETLNPLANDAGEADATVTNRFWSFTGETTAGLAIGTGGVSGDGRCLDLDTDEAVLLRNFSPLTPLDATNAVACAVGIPAKGSVVGETHVTFRRSNVLPTLTDVLAEDKLVLGVYGDDTRTALYAFAGYATADGREMRAYRLNVAVSSAWLSEEHHVRLRAFADAFADGTPGYFVEVDGRSLRVAGVSAISAGELAAEVPAGNDYLGAASVSARFASCVGTRRLLAGLSTASVERFRALGFQGKGRIDDIAVYQREKDSFERCGSLMIVR